MQGIRCEYTQHIFEDIHRVVYWYMLGERRITLYWVNIYNLLVDQGWNPTSNVDFFFKSIYHQPRLSLQRLIEILCLLISESAVHKIILHIGYWIGLIDISHYCIIMIIVFIIVYVILIDSHVSGSGTQQSESRNTFSKFPGGFDKWVLYNTWKSEDKPPQQISSSPHTITSLFMFNSTPMINP